MLLIFFKVILTSPENTASLIIWPDVFLNNKVFISSVNLYSSLTTPLTCNSCTLMSVAKVILPIQIFLRNYLTVKF